MSRFLGLGRASEGFNCRRRHSSWEAAQRRSPRSFPKERANSQSYNCKKGSGQNSPSQDRISFLGLWQGKGEALRPACAVDCMSDQDFLTLSPRKRKMTGPVVMSVTWESRAGLRLRTGVTSYHWSGRWPSPGSTVSQVRQATSLHEGLGYKWQHESLGRSQFWGSPHLTTP